MAFGNRGERGAGSCELLRGPAVLQIVQEGAEKNKIIGGPKGGRKGKVNKPKQTKALGAGGRLRSRGALTPCGEPEERAALSSKGARQARTLLIISMRRTVRQHGSRMEAESVRLGTEAKATMSEIHA
eukprot:6188230-Pleurochrysis_carterae.AAC.2